MLIENEGFSAKPYKDTRGNRTIGLGFNLDDPTISSLLDSDTDITEQKSLNILTTKLLPRAEREAASYVSPRIFSKLTPGAQDALVDLSYNLGAKKLDGFKNVRMAIQQGDTSTAFLEVLNSDYAQQVPSRALRNAYMIRTGQNITKERAVRIFQAEHGLTPDGIVGPKTRATLKKFRRRK